MHRDDHSADALLAAMSDPGNKIDAHRVAIVVAHPDDETIGCGGQLTRLVGAHIILVTDGAPRHMKDARARGCSSVSEYRELRTREWKIALAIGGVPSERQLPLGIPDQQAAFKLDWITARLATLLRQRRITTVITHAYEGGHPDHDATAFAVHRAARLLGETGEPVHIVEMPFYREKAGQMALQSFAPMGGNKVFRIALSEPQLGVKTAMCAAYASQADVLAPFAREVEKFRRAPVYDFRLPANGGKLLYERFDWGLTGEQWMTIATAAAMRVRPDRRR